MGGRRRPLPAPEADFARLRDEVRTTKLFKGSTRCLRAPPRFSVGRDCGECGEAGPPPQRQRCEPFLIGTSNQLEVFESGVTASFFGLVPAIAIGGLGSVGVALLWVRFFPGLCRLHKLRRR